MDVGELLRQARRRAGLNQRLLAQRAGTQQTTISSYETGRVSPTVDTLNRLLAACGLQARARLEPLLAELDARVDALLSGTPELATEQLPNLILTLDDDPDGNHASLSRQRPTRKGPVTWAFDGATALVLHGLAAQGHAAELVIVWDEAARWWLRAIGAPARNAKGHTLSWLDAPLEDVREHLERPTWTLVGFLRIRLVAELPPTIAVAVPWFADPVPVVTVDGVERGCPEHAEVLARWRERRAG